MLPRTRAQWSTYLSLHRAEYLSATYSWQREIEAWWIDTLLDVGIEYGWMDSHAERTL